MEERFRRNMPALSLQQQETLGKKRALLVGCGGLGGYVMEYLLRAGVGHLTVMDGDRFEESNRNRQLLSGADTAGFSKAEAAARRAGEIAPETVFAAFPERLTGENAAARVRGMDIVLDALDNVESRLALEEACAAAGVSLVHGAVSGWTYQVAVIPPGSGLLRQLYRGKSGGGSTLSFVPALCAAVQAAEAIKLLVGLPSALSGNLLIGDLRTMETEIIELKGI